MLVEIEDLSVSRRGNPILHDVRLSVGEGEIYGLLGPNGSGKSTTIAVALGLLAPSSGSVRVFGKDPRAFAPIERARLGVLPEQNGFYDWMSGEEYLAFFSALHGRPLSLEAARRRIAGTGLQSRAGQTIGTYSRGMRQRLGLARALTGFPKLLVLDEPTNGLDPRGRREIHDILLELADTGVGILLCTHLLDDVERLCSRIGIIDAGKTVVQGSLAALVAGAGPSSRFRLRLVGALPADGKDAANVSIVARDGDWLVVDVDPGRRIEATWRELLNRGWPIGEIRGDADSLEDLYLSLTHASAA